jgi:hypothetical protein
LIFGCRGAFLIVGLCLSLTVMLCQVDCKIVYVDQLSEKDLFLLESMWAAEAPLDFGCGSRSAIAFWF